MKYFLEAVWFEARYQIDLIQKEGRQTRLDSWLSWIPIFKTISKEEVG